MGCAGAAGGGAAMIEVRQAMLDGLTSAQAGGGGHGAACRSTRTKWVARGGLKVSRNLTSACTRPATRVMSSNAILRAGA
jgi:hypothetical protein